MSRLISFDFFSRLSILSLYRLLSMMGALGFVGMIPLSRPDMVDPVWMRVAVSGGFLLVFVLSYVSSWCKRHIASLVPVMMLLATTWSTGLLYLNHFRPENVAGYLVLAFSSVLAFDSRTLLFIFSILNLAGLAVVGILVGGDAIFPIPIFFTLIVVVFLVVNLALGWRIASRKMLRTGLSKAETTQFAAIDSSRDAIMLVDENGVPTKCNPAFVAMWKFNAEGCSQEELDRCAMLQLRDEDVLENYLHRVPEYALQGDRAELAFKDGRIIDSYWHPIRLDRRLVGRLWFFRDITQQRKDEERLKATEKRLRQQNERLLEFAANPVLTSNDQEKAFEEITRATAEILEVDSVGIWFFEPEKGNIRLEKNYKRHSAEFQSGISFPIQTYSEYQSALTANRVLAVNDTLSSDLTREFYEGKYTGRAAALMHVLIRITGKSVGVISMESASGPREWTLEDQSYASSMADLVALSLEVRERNKVQQELESSLATLRAIFELSETGIIVEDNDHNILHHNELYEKVWNMPHDFVETSPYPVILAHCLEQLENRQSAEDALARLKEKPGIEYAGILNFKDGKVVERFSKALVVGGKLIGRVWFYLDITERQQKEMELINRNFELDSFVYRASHDLKAPLNSIMGLIDIMRDEKEIDAVLSYIGMMDKSVQKLDDFIKQLTQFSQDARLQVVLKPIQFSNFIHDILEDLRFMDKASRLQVETDIVQDAPFATDPVRLAIVLNNVISNAIKYQDLRKPQSTLKIHVRADAQEAMCCFEDNGVGIEETHLEKVFELFFRASIQASGTGLGLYITHNAVQKLDGKITVASKFGEGTTFTLRIPNWHGGM